jgi:hypothetical protein
LVQAKTLTTLAVATLVGAGLGVHLGYAAIGAVDPFYFTDPAGTESYAELVPAASRSRPWSNDVQSAGADYGWPASCVGCGSDPRVYRAAPYDGFQVAWTAPEDPSPRYAVVEMEPDVGAEIEAVAAGIDRELEQVERYAHYPVSHEAARAHLAAIAVVTETGDTVAASAQPEEASEASLLPETLEISSY